MPILSPRTASQTGWPANPLDRRVTLARAILAIERVLPRLWPAFGFIGFYLALALTGIFAFIAWPLQALLLAAAITASGFVAFDGLKTFAWPRSLDAARRLNATADWRTVPSERDDVLVGGSFAKPYGRCTARTLPGKFAWPAAHRYCSPRSARPALVSLIALAVGTCWRCGTPARG